MLLNNKNRYFRNLKQYYYVLSEQQLENRTRQISIRLFSSYLHSTKFFHCFVSLGVDMLDMDRVVFCGNQRISSCCFNGWSLCHNIKPLYSKANLPCIFCAEHTKDIKHKLFINIEHVQEKPKLVNW